MSISVRYFGDRNPNTQRPLGQYSWPAKLPRPDAHVDFITGRVKAQREASSAWEDLVKSPIPFAGDPQQVDGRVRVSEGDEAGFLGEKIGGSLEVNNNKIVLKGEEAFAPTEGGLYYSTHPKTGLPGWHPIEKEPVQGGAQPDIGIDGAWDKEKEQGFSRAVATAISVERIPYGVWTEEEKNMFADFSEEEAGEPLYDMYEYYLVVRQEHTGKDGTTVLVNSGTKAALFRVMVELEEEGVPT